MGTINCFARGSDSEKCSSLVFDCLNQSVDNLSGPTRSFIFSPPLFLAKNFMILHFNVKPAIIFDQPSQPASR